MSRVLECPACHRLYPEVSGAPTQVCPHCQHEATVEGDVEAASAARAAKAAAQIPADPVGAMQLALRIARATYPRLLLLALPPVLVYVAFTLGLAAYEDSLGLPVDLATWTLSQRMRWAGLALPGFLLWSAAVLGSWTTISARVLDAAEGTATRTARPGLLGPALLCGFVLTLTFAAGLVLLLVGFFVVLHWFMYAPALLANGARGVGAAFDASRRFARDRRAYGFTALVVLVGFVALLPFLFGGATLVVLLVTSVVGWLLAPAVPLLLASFVALASGKVAAGPIPEAPKAPKKEDAPKALQPRSGRTACPSCGTSIEYTPTGFPVDVVCPSCGKAGRVL